MKNLKFFEKSNKILCLFSPSPLDSNKRGAFIVFEGIDRCGKSTQATMLADALKETGIETVHMRFPGNFSIVLLFWRNFCLFLDNSTSIGKILRSYLENRAEMEDHATHLMFAANRWECK